MIDTNLAASSEIFRFIQGELKIVCGLWIVKIDKYFYEGVNNLNLFTRDLMLAAVPYSSASSLLTLAI